MTASRSTLPGSLGKPLVHAVRQACNGALTDGSAKSRSDWAPETRCLLACLDAVSDASTDVCGDKSIMPKPTHFQVDSAKCRVGKGHGCPNQPFSWHAIVQVTAQLLRLLPGSKGHQRGGAETRMQPQRNDDPAGLKKRRLKGARRSARPGAFHYRLESRSEHGGGQLGHAFGIVDSGFDPFLDQSLLGVGEHQSPNWKDF